MDEAKTTPKIEPSGLVTFVVPILAVAQLTISFLGLSALLGERLKADPEQVVPLIISLSSVIIGVVFAGAVAGTLAVKCCSSITALNRVPRFVMALSGGVVIGLVAAVCGYVIFQDAGGVSTVMATVAGVSGVIGGMLALPPKQVVVTACLVGTSTLVVFLFLRGLFLQDLLDVLVRTPDTFRWIGILGGVAAGMCAGFGAYLYLRLRKANVTLYGYMGAGASAGGLWLLSEVITRITGTILLGASEIGMADELYLSQAGDAQLNGSLATTFAGATTAVLAFGLLSGNSSSKKKPVASRSSKSAKPVTKKASAR